MTPALVVPTADLHASWLAAREESPADAHLDGAGLRQQDDVDSAAGFAAWTAHLRRCADTSVPPGRGWVHATHRWLVEDGTYLGAVDLRHSLTPFLLEAGGHVGYGVRPSARRRGLATWALARTLERARELGLGRVLLTCDPRNEASRRVIERNGGELEDVRRTVVGRRCRYWVVL